MTNISVFPGERIYVREQLIIEYLLEDGDIRRPHLKVAPHHETTPLICDDLAHQPNAQRYRIQEGEPVTLTPEIDVTFVLIKPSGLAEVIFDAPLSLPIFHEKRLLGGARTLTTKKYQKDL